MIPGGDMDRALDMVAALCPESDRATYVVVPGIPCSKARARFGRGRHAYTPKETLEAQENVAAHLRPQFPVPLTGNLAIGCLFFRPNRQRIDVDNLMKLVLDAATGVCWADDSQVTAMLGVLEYDPQLPRTVIIIGDHVSSMDRRPPQPRPCAVCSSEFTPKKTNPTGRYCSPACARRSRTTLEEPVACEQCGAGFRRATTSQRFCSTGCARAYSRGRPRGGALRPACRTCGQPVSKAGYRQCRNCYLAGDAVPTQLSFAPEPAISGGGSDG